MFFSSRVEGLRDEQETIQLLYIMFMLPLGSLLPCENEMFY